MDADEIQDGAGGLVPCLAQTASELLQEQGRALGGPQHEHHIDRGHVDTLVEQVDREHHPDASVGQVPERRPPQLLRRLRGHRHCGDTELVELSRHELRVTHADAESEAAHGGGVVGRGLNCFRIDEPGPGVVGGVDVAQRFDVVALTAPPRHRLQVEAVMDAVVRERRQPVLLDGIPESELGGDPVVEPLQDGPAVGAFRRRRQTQQFAWPQAVQERLVGVGCGVVELVHDHDVEVVRVEMLQRRWPKALHGSEDVLESGRTLAAHPLLAEGEVAHRMPERRPALIQDLLPVRHEQQPGSGEAPRATAGSRSQPSPSCRCRWRPPTDCDGGRAPATLRSVRAIAPGTVPDESRSGSGRGRPGPRDASTGPVHAEIRLRRRRENLPPANRSRTPPGSSRSRPGSALRICGRSTRLRRPGPSGSGLTSRRMRCRTRIAGGTATPWRAAGWCSGRTTP